MGPGQSSDEEDSEEGLRRKSSADETEKRLYDNLRYIQNTSEKKSSKSKINSRAFLGLNNTGY